MVQERVHKRRLPRSTAIELLRHILRASEAWEQNSSARFSSQPNVDFGLPRRAILGDVSDNLSLMIAFNYTLVVALAFYSPPELLASKPAREQYRHL
jgi:hypothetical protein